MDTDQLTPQLRRIVDAAGDLDEKLLVLLLVRKAEPAPILAELLGRERGETMAALGRLSQNRLVGHQRPEGEPIHWFATSEGKTRGEKLHRTLAAKFLAEPDPLPAPPAAEPPAPEPGTEGHQKVKARRRVSIDQNEKTGFSWD